MNGLPPRHPRPNGRAGRSTIDAPVVEVFMEGDEDGASFLHSRQPEATEHDDHNEHAPDETAADTVSIEELVREVEEAKREVDHLWFLLLRAVWHAVVDLRGAPSRHTTAARSGSGNFPPRQRPRASHPLTVEERREQLRAARARDRVGDTSFGNHTLDTSRNRSGSKPPFLPPARYPVTPPLNPDEVLRIHHHLYRAVSSVMATTSFSSTAGMGKLLPGLSAAAASSMGKSSRSRASTSAGTPSLRTAALKAATEALSSPTVDQQRTPSSSSLIRNRRASPPLGVRASRESPPLSSSASCMADDAPSPVLQSVSILILQVARRRAVATLFLRRLRLSVYVRQARQADVDLRHDYYLQRRVLRNWHIAASEHARRARRIQQLCVSVWQEAVRERQQCRLTMQRYVEGVRMRAARYAAWRQQQRRRYWQRWKDAFTYQRVEHALAATATAFRQSHPQRRDPLLSLRTGAPSVDGAIVQLSAMTDRYAARCLFRQWRQRYMAHAQVRLADEAYRRLLRRRVVRRACAVGATASQRAAANPRPRASLTEPIRSRALTVQVRRPAVEGYLWGHKAMCATRVSQSRLLQRCFGRWRCRCEVRTASRFRNTQLRLAALRLWLSATCRHEQQRATRLVVWQRWRERFTRRAADRRVSLPVRNTQLLRTVLKTWQELTRARRLRAWQLVHGCLRHWWQRAALRAAVPALECGRRAGLFRRWRDRAAEVRHRRLSLALADTLREMALLLGALRLWSARCADRRHGLAAAAVFEELRSEKRLQRLFTRWKRRTFGSTEPFP